MLYEVITANVAVIGQKGESIDEFKPGAEPVAETLQAEEPIEESPKVFEFEVEESEDGARVRISSYNFV